MLKVIVSPAPLVGDLLYKVLQYPGDMEKKQVKEENSVESSQIFTKTLEMLHGCFTIAPYTG